jgi:hypothetical protein
MLARDEGFTAPLHAVSKPDGTSPAAQLPRPGTVKAGHCQGRVDIETAEATGRERRGYAAFVRRVLRAYSRRVGDGDVEALSLIVGLADELDAAMAEAVSGLRAHGYSWAEIGLRLGISRQAAQQRWGTS